MPSSDPVFWVAFLQHPPPRTWASPNATGPRWGGTSLVAMDESQRFKRQFVAGPSRSLIFVGP